VPEQAAPRADGQPFVGVLVDFARELRAAGLPVGPGDTLTYCTAMTPLDPTDLLDLYWAGRTTMVIQRDHIPVYDRVFRAFFLDQHSETHADLKLTIRERADIQAVLTVPESEPDPTGQDHAVQLGLLASDTSALKSKSFARCTPQELAALRRIMARIRLTPPRRRTRRVVASRSGHLPDLRRTARETMRLHGDPAQLLWRTRRLRVRPLILILDVSGSMADYSRSLLQFAYSTKRAASRVEVFCFGTRLTRITAELEHRRPDDALERASRAVFDWEGGTRIGDCLDAFVRRWGRRGMCRGGIVVICSDGLDRGDPAVLAASMDRLSRLSHRVVWMNPHKGNGPGWQPSTLGMMVAHPHVDVMLSGHDLRSLEEFARLLPTLS